MADVEFWFDLVSTYSYLSAMRIEAQAARRGRTVAWRPFLLGPVFKAQGWETSPFNLYPAKGRYMVRDMERLAEARGLAFRLPMPFPQNSLRAARMALVGSDAGWTAAFVTAVFAAEFQDGADISDPSVLDGICGRLGLDPRSIRSASEADALKQRLRDATDEAMAKGIFGAPTFVTADGELFWGDDRLEAALDWPGGQQKE
jgi:2-hydroxychromene-2-carboxylate isomerase